jgi:hypothetical protein
MKKIQNQNINLKWFLEKKLKKKIQKKTCNLFLLFTYGKGVYQTLNQSILDIL